MIYARVVFTILICVIFSNIRCGIEKEQHDTFCLLKQRALKADKIRSGINKLVINKYLESISEDQLTSLVTAIQEDWNKVIKLRLRYYVTLGTLFEELNRFEDDERRNYEHVEMSKFKQSADALSEVIKHIARKHKNDQLEPKTQSKTQTFTSPLSETSIPDGGVFEIEL